jgi:hypothetical protein
MSKPFQSLEAVRLRSKAAACGVFAAHAASGADRDLFLRMQRAWLDRAYHQDLVDELPPMPPGCSCALAVPRN